MKKAILCIFDKWWISILFCVFATIFFIISPFAKNNIVDDASVFLFGFSLLILLISIIYQGIKRKWLKFILTFLFFCGIVVVWFIYSIFIHYAGVFFDGTDRFADNLTIPNDIPIEIPLNCRIFDSVSNKQDFQLYNSVQPGIYEYDFWIGKIESGTIYLKAFEITKEYALSTDRLPKSSSIRIYNPTDNIKKFGTTSDFTIYEGDWGKPYAARFEVWFKPDDGGKERKLLSKNYKIEGWMR